MTLDQSIELRHVAGVPVLIADAPPPFAVGLHFRVGRADETAPISGLTHLAEHLVFPSPPATTVDFNGSVDNLCTSMWASGAPAEVAAFISGIVQRIRRPPLDRLELERRVLVAEQRTRSLSGGNFSLALRYGARTHGLLGYEEYGLPVLADEQVETWLRERFTRGNVVVTAAGPIDDLELDLDLAEGTRREPPPLHPIPEVTYPAIYAGYSSGGLLLAGVARRTTAASFAGELVQRRIEQRLRYELGISYDVGTSFLPLGPDTGHTVVAGDVSDDRVRDAVDESMKILREVAAGTARQDELEVARETRRRATSDPTQLHAYVWWCAHQLLLGVQPESRAELQLQADSLSAEDVAVAAGQLLESALVLAPEAAAGAGDLAAYPVMSARTLDGARLRLRGLRSKRIPAVVVGDDGIMLEAEHGVITAPFEGVAVARRQPDGSRMLLTNDGFFLVVDPGAWKSGDEIVRTIDERLADRFVDADPAATRREARLAELSASLGRTGLVSDELGALPRLLEEGEEPIRLAKGTRGWRYGLLVVTDRRLLFVYDDGTKHLLEVPLAEVRTVESGSDWLHVEWQGNGAHLKNIEPGDAADALALAIRSFRKASAPS